MKVWYERTPVHALFALLLLSLPIFIRFLQHDPLIPGAASYNHLATTNLYSLLLQSLAHIGELRIILSVLLGLATFLIFTRITNARQPYLTILFLLNPLFLFTFTTLSPATLALPLALLGYLLDKSHSKIFPIIPLLVALLSPTLALLLLALLFIKKKEKRFIFLGSAVILEGLLLKNFGTLQLTPFVAEFGILHGISLLFTLFALFEAAFEWRLQSNRARLLLLLLLAVGALFSMELRLGFSILTLPLAAAFLKRVIHRRWILTPLCSTIQLLLFCSLLFLLLSHLLGIAEQEPAAELVDLMAALPSSATLLLPEPLAPIAHHYAAATLHTLPETELQLLYSARRTATAAPLLEGVTHFLLTEQMKEELWSRDDEGLLFLLQHSGQFRLIKQNTLGELWEYRS